MKVYGPRTADLLRATTGTKKLAFTLVLNGVQVDAKATKKKWNVLLSGTKNNADTVANGVTTKNPPTATTEFG